MAIQRKRILLASRSRLTVFHKSISLWTTVIPKKR
ncbi:Uncharacterised protein [Vibrio cholerae]|nr:Uncharacterised protein [Vibrio cholerae]